MISDVHREDQLARDVAGLAEAAKKVQERTRSVQEEVNVFLDDYKLALEDHRQHLLRQASQEFYFMF